MARQRIPRLSLGSFVRVGAVCHVASVTYGPRSAGRLHTHDLAEVFWVTSGRGTHLINGRRVPLGEGDMVLIRPSDAHTFAASGQRGFTIVNVAFEARRWREHQQRYFSEPDVSPWSDAAALPAHVALGAVSLRRFDEWSRHAAAHPPAALQLDAFLLQVLDAALPAPPSHDALPAWLAEAMGTFAEPGALAAGVHELVRLTGKSPEHVGRVLRRTLGQTPTEYVNATRLDHAARRLRMSARPIVAIALECGFENLGYFYRRFGQRFGTTPRRYRLREQAVAR